MGIWSAFLKLLFVEAADLLAPRRRHRIEEVTADQLVRPVTQQVLHGRIDVSEDALAVGAIDDVPGVAHEIFHPLIGFAQRALGLIASSYLPDDRNKNM